MILLRAHGSAAGLTCLLDWLHIRAAVSGVQELEGAVEVWLEGLPADLPEVIGVAVELEPVQVVAECTGLEQDKVVYVAPDLIVRPPWVAAPSRFVGIELVVPRGMAFGSGEHESTQAALLVMHAVLEPLPTSLLDVGTGSGILARYAATRGVPRVLACDIEAAAVRAAAELVPSAELRLGGPEVFGANVADAVVANLSGDEQRDHLDAILAAWRGTGPLVLAGMRDGEMAGIAARLPVAPVEQIQRGEFFALGLAPIKSSSTD